MKQYQTALDSFERAERFASHSYEIHKGKAFIHLEQSEVSNRNDIIVRWEIVPSNPDSSSIFTLPVEFPRYRSLLLGMPTGLMRAKHAITNRTPKNRGALPFRFPSNKSELTY